MLMLEVGMRGAVVLLFLAVGGCSLLPASRPDPAAHPGVVPAQTWVAVHTPADGVAPQEMSLEVGEHAWSITVDGGPGVVADDLPEVTLVRLVGMEDCHVYAAFDAAPGGLYSIRFADDGSVSVDEVEVMEAGPGLNERDAGPADCD